MVGKEQGDSVVFIITKNGEPVNEIKNAGSYEVTATVTRNGYKPYTTNTVNLTVEKAQAVITAETEQTIPYDGNYHYPDAQLNHAEADLALKSKAVIAVGNYEFTLSARETENFLAAAPVTVSIAVTETYTPVQEPATAGPITIPQDAISTEHDGKVVTTGSFNYNGYSANGSAFWFSITYANSMMFQANMATRVYGKTNVNGAVVVLVESASKGYSQAFYGQTESTKDGDKYPFTVYVNVPYGSDYRVTVINANKQSQSFTNVAFGELFLAGGQSNMGWNMSQCYDGTGTFDSASGSFDGLLYKDIIENSANSNIRLASVYPAHQGEKVDTLSLWNGWSEATVNKVKGFSAAAYFFVRELQEQYPDVPFGIIGSCMGGTSIYAWMEWDSYTQAISEGWVQGRTSVADDPGENNPSSAGSRYYNAMTNPIRHHSFRGVLWYQGCGHYNNYSNLFNLMIQDWRDLFDNQKLWFIDCGLPRYGNEDSWYRVRDEHEFASTFIPNLVYSTNIEDGLYAQHADPVDTLNADGIHPYKKQSVGEHAAHTMMKKMYGAQGTWSGPEITSVAISGPSVILTFNNVAEGLVLKGLTGFNIAGPDGVFYDATPVLLSKNTIMISAEEVSNPVEIRYGYANYSKFVTRESCTGAHESVSVFNKKGDDYWPLDQFWFLVNAQAQTVEKKEWHATEYVNILQNGLYSTVQMNTAYDFSLTSNQVAAIKNEPAIVPTAKVLKNGLDVSGQVTAVAYYKDGYSEAINLNNPKFTKAGDVSIVYFVGSDVVGSLESRVHDFVPVKEFAMQAGPFSALTGQTFVMPEMKYTIRNEDSSVILDMSDIVRIVADYGEYEEEVTSSYVQRIKGNYTLNFYLGNTLLGSREVVVGVSQQKNQMVTGTWERVPGQSDNCIKNYALYNGEVSYKFNYNISAGGNLFYPVRGNASNAPNLEYFNGLSVRLGSVNGVAKLMIAYNIENVLTSVMMPDVDTSATAEHVLTYKVQDIYKSGGKFNGVRVTVYFDGQERIDFTVPADTVNADKETYFTPAVIFNAKNVANQEIYVDGTRPYTYQLEGEFAQTLPYGETADLPVMNVIYPDKVVFADVYVDGSKIDPATYVFDQKKTYTISYKYGDQVLYEVEKVCAADLTFAVTPVTEAQVPGTVNLPTLVAKEGDTDIRANVDVTVRMGAKVIATLKGNATTLTHSVASVLTLEYYYQGSLMATSEMTVIPSGNLLDDTANWKSGRYTAIKQYNARVNITYFVKGNMADVISLPIRGDNFNNVTYHDGLAFRPSVRDCFLMNPLQNGGHTYASFSQRSTNKYHTWSYQAVDVLNEDGSLKEIRVYTWVDGVLQKVGGFDYAVISVADTANFYNTYYEVAGFVQSGNAGYTIAAITFGDNMPLDYVVNMEMSGATLSGAEYDVIYGTEYEFVTTGIDATVESVQYFNRGSSTALSEKPTRLGSYTAKITVSAPGYDGKTFVVDYKISENVMAGLAIYGQSVDYGNTASIVFENLPQDATVTYTYGTLTDTATAPALTESGASLTVTVKVVKYGYKTVTATVNLTVIPVEIGEEWTQSMKESVSAPSVTTAYVGVPYVYEAAVNMSGVSIEYYYKGALLSENFSTSTLGSYELEVRFVKEGYKSYKVTVNIEVIELLAKDVTFTATGVSTATIGTAFTLPTATATHKVTGENLTAHLVRSASYGAYAVTDLTKEATSYTATVFGTMTLTYKVNGVKVGAKDIEIGTTDNLIETGTWNKRILQNYTVYNARVNVKFSISSTSTGLFFIPLRGTSTNNEWWGNDRGALSFRVPAARDGQVFWIYNSGNGLGSVNSNVFFTHSDWLAGTEHTLSYQVKDILNEDGSIKEIRVYVWVDNVAICPGTQTGGIVHVDDNMGTLTGYFVVEPSNANWKSWFTEPANFLQFKKINSSDSATITTSSITIG